MFLNKQDWSCLNHLIHVSFNYWIYCERESLFILINFHVFIIMLFKYENIIDFVDFNKTVAYLKFLTKLLTSCCETGQEEYVRAWTTAPPLSISKWTNRNVIYQRRTVRFAIIHHRLMNYILFTRSEEFLIDPLPSIDASID